MGLQPCLRSPGYRWETGSLALRLIPISWSTDLCGPLPAFLWEIESLKFQTWKIAVSKGVGVCVWEETPTTSVKREVELRRREESCEQENPDSTWKLPPASTARGSSCRCIPAWANPVWSSAAPPREEQEEMRDMRYEWVGMESKSSQAVAPMQPYQENGSICGSPGHELPCLGLSEVREAGTKNIFS